jgi:hypothetical protein
LKGKEEGTCAKRKAKRKNEEKQTGGNPIEGEDFIEIRGRV